MAEKIPFFTVFHHKETPTFKCKTPSMTEQQFEYETNINNVVKGCVSSSLPSQTRAAIYGLTITGNEWQQACDTVADVQNSFEQLPANAKKYFKYDPKNMLAFVQNQENYEKAFELGLLDKRAYFDRKDALKALKDNVPSGVTSTEENPST